MKDAKSEIACYLLIALIGLLILLPVINVCTAGFQIDGKWTAFFLINAITRDIYLHGIYLSFLVATTVTVLVLIISTILTYFLTRYRIPGRSLLIPLLYSPLILPPFVGAIGIRKAFAMFGGPINIAGAKLLLIDPSSPPNYLGDHIFPMVVLLETFHLYPIMLLSMQAAISQLDPAYEESGLNLGAKPWQVFIKITLPLAKSGIFAGATIVFIWSFTELGTPLMLGWTEIAPVEIFRGLQSIDIRPQPYILIVFLLILSSIFYISVKVILGKETKIQAARYSGSVQKINPGRLMKIVSVCFILLIIAVATLPHIMVIAISFAEKYRFSILPQSLTLSYHKAIMESNIADVAVKNSLNYSVMSMMVDILLGIPSAYIITRTRARARRILDALCMLPLAIPGLVMAFGFLAISAEGNFFDFLNPRTHDPTAILVIAYAIRRLPFVVRGLSAGLEQIPYSLEESAKNIGAGGIRTFLFITLPLMAPAVVASSILTFSFSMLEVSDSLILAYWQEDYPITKAIWELSFQLMHGPNIACALGLWGMILLLITITSAWALMGKTMGNVFRV